MQGCSAGGSQKYALWRVLYKLPIKEMTHFFNDMHYDTSLPTHNIKPMSGVIFMAHAHKCPFQLFDMIFLTMVIVGHIYSCVHIRCE